MYVCIYLHFIIAVRLYVCAMNWCVLSNVSAYLPFYLSIYLHAWFTCLWLHWTNKHCVAHRRWSSCRSCFIPMYTGTVRSAWTSCRTSGAPSTTSRASWPPYSLCSATLTQHPRPTQVRLPCVWFALLWLWDPQYSHERSSLYTCVCMYCMYVCMQWGYECKYTVQ